MGKFSRPIFGYIGTGGLSTGTTNFIGNYSAGQTAFIQPPEGKVWIINKMSGTIADDANFRADEYGGVGLLTNGISIKIYENNEVIADITNGNPIKNVEGWASIGCTAQYDEFGSGNNYFIFGLSFSTCNIPIRLMSNMKIEIAFADDFTGLIGHRFHFQGYTE